LSSSKNKSEIQGIMENNKVLFLLFILFLGFTSCITTSDLNTIQVELMKPSIIDESNELDTIAIFKRDSYKSDTVSFKFYSNYKLKADTAIHYRDLSNICVDALTDYLKNEGYFTKVINYRDSMNFLFTEKDSLINYLEFYKKSGFDACIFLDYFQFNDSQYKEKNYWTSGIKNFDEFVNSTYLESVAVNLYWTIAFREMNPKIVYKQNDYLFYGNSVNPEFFGSNNNHKELLKNSSIFLGKAFGAELIPTWQKNERAYYRSKNKNMKKAEEYCQASDWLNAAEYYKIETKNKSRKIAAKAMYNMALTSEMEGNLDIALGWLNLSLSSYWNENNDHKSICQKYFDLLTIRKQEIERLEKQVENLEKDKSE